MDNGEEREWRRKRQHGWTHTLLVSVLPALHISAENGFCFHTF